MAMIGDPDAEIREAAVVAAARTSGPQGDAALIRALDDESERVKRAALEGVAGRGLKAARDPLRLLCRYQNADVRMAAVKAWLSILEPGEAATEFDFLRELLFDKDQRIKLMVIPVVSGIRERRAIGTLSSLVIDPSDDVKLAVLNALAATGERDATEGIMKAVFDDDQAIRLAALEALKKLGRKDALDFMSELINLEQDEVIRVKAEEVRQYLLMR
jgi:HEAT repeat protein